MKREEYDRQKLFTRRAIVIGGLQGSFMVGLLGRLYYLSVMQSERYRMMAEENRIDLRLLPPPRGMIVDRSGVALARNRQNYRVVLVPEQTSRSRKSRKSELLDHVALTLDKLSKLVPLSEYDQKRILREASRKRSFMPITVVENLSWDAFARVNVHAPDIPGISPEVGESRFYPKYDSFAHVLGYVAAVSEKDLKASDDPVLELPGFQIGKLGVERLFESELRGVTGTSKVEVNAVGRIIREVQRDNGQPGQAVTLTLDSGLQEYAKVRFGSETGAVVVMDSVTGEIIVAVSVPGYDPNKFVWGISNNDWNILLSNQRSPMTNKVASGQYPPGSTFKMIVALAGLEAGIIDPRDTIFCRGHVDLGSHRFHCWKKHGHGLVNMHDSIKQSCDVYYYEMAQRIGIDRIAAMAERFGLGVAPDVPLSSVRKGLIPNRNWKRAVKGESWYRGETLNASIGQGQVLATPLQLAIMTACLANGELSVQPVMVKNVAGIPVPNPNIDAPKLLNVNRKHIEWIQKSMWAVVNKEGGTAHAVRSDPEGRIIAGKTGTVQVRRITRAERDAGLRKNEQKAWEERDHALFVGFGPVTPPRYAIAAILEHGGSGSQAAAPVAADILREVMRRDPSRREERIASQQDMKAMENPAVNDGGSGMLNISETNTEGDSGNVR